MLAPILATDRSGDVGGAVDGFMNMVAPTADWRGELAAALPAGPEQANQDAPVAIDELLGFGDWTFDGDRAGRLGCPIVYCWGSETGPLIDPLKDHFLSLVPKTATIVLPGVDHSMNTQNPALVAGAVAEFLARQS
jgi:pimeloyl-ACP methyl ester carboxylesterase